MRRAHIFWDYEFTDGGAGGVTKTTGSGVSRGYDMGERMQEYFKRWPPLTYRFVKLVCDYNPRRFRP